MGNSRTAEFADNIYIYKLNIPLLQAQSDGYGSIIAEVTGNPVPLFVEMRAL